MKAARCCFVTLRQTWLYHYICKPLSAFSLVTDTKFSIIVLANWVFFLNMLLIFKCVKVSIVSLDQSAKTELDHFDGSA